MADCETAVSIVQIPTLYFLIIQRMAMDRKEYTKILIEKGESTASIVEKVGKKFEEGISKRTVQRIRKEINDELNDEEDAIEVAYEESKEKQKLRKEKAFLEKKDSKLMSELDSANKKLDLIAVAQRDDGSYKITRSKKPEKKTESTAVICASDRHIEENVDPETIDGINEYNLAIAEHRATNFFKNSLKLVDSFENETKIPNIVLWLGGDFIS